MAGVVRDRPIGAFALAFLAAVFHLIGGLGVQVLGFAAVMTVGFTDLLPLLAGGITVIALTGIFILLAFLGAFWLYSRDKRRVTQGGVVTLAISILALPTLWGLIIGSILGFLGAILALVWDPRPPQATPLTPRIAPPTGGGGFRP